MWWYSYLIIIDFCTQTVLAASTKYIQLVRMICSLLIITTIYVSHKHNFTPQKSRWLKNSTTLDTTWMLINVCWTKGCPWEAKFTCKYQIDPNTQETRNYFGNPYSHEYSWTLNLQKRQCCLLWHCQDKEGLEEKKKEREGMKINTL